MFSGHVVTKFNNENNNGIALSTLYARRFPKHVKHIQLFHYYTSFVK